ncbi:MAG: enoyl-CoA hydratase/isomerase family protein [Candidatus Rokubacteria bacterium]|nr:enoyl-CoA hydratase/isomerase family protein [Candidatus Rokubacteria bacterium]
MELLYGAKDGVATLTLNRPDKLNAVTDAMRQALARHVEAINHDPEVRVVVLRGAGTRAFSTGSDIYETSGRTPVEKRDTVEMEAPHLLRRCVKPVVAMIRGYALGGGLELALACDLRIASETAEFGMPEVTLGWIPGAGGTQYLPRLVGRGMAAYLLYTGERIDATQAKAIGLVDFLVPDHALDADTERIAGLIARNRLEALVFLKAALRMADRASPEVGVDYERELIALCYSFPDREARIRAFRDRKPRDPQA